MEKQVAQLDVQLENDCLSQMQHGSIHNFT